MDVFVTLDTLTQIYVWPFEPSLKRNINILWIELVVFYLTSPCGCQVGFNLVALNSFGLNWPRLEDLKLRQAGVFFVYVSLGDLGRAYAHVPHAKDLFLKLETE